MGKAKVTTTRMMVLDILQEWSQNPQKLNVLVKDVLDKYDYMDSRDKAFMKRLAEGCAEQKIKLDYVIDCYASTGTKKIKPIIRNILRIGVYQILFMDSVPDSAACNEAVNMACAKGLQGLKGFVNGVLRKIVREKDKIPWPDKRDTVSHYSIRYSMPEWIVEYCLKEYGEDIMIKMFERMSAVPELTIRLNGTKTEEIVSALEAGGHEPKQHPYLPYAYTIYHVEGMEQVPGFAEGKFTVQDISSQLAVELAGIGQGDYVMDVCAAPGGKSMHAAEKTGETGMVDARDVIASKIYLMQENAERLKIRNIKMKVQDACEEEESMYEKADVVIADLPCSGLGVMGRKGDIRYQASLDGIRELAALQRKILSVVSKYVKPGGILLYSTCTITKEENLENREWILENTGLLPVSIEEILPEALKGSTGTEGYLQLLPGVHESDGFFIAKFMKKAE